LRRAAYPHKPCRYSTARAAPNLRFRRHLLHIGAASSRRITLLKKVLAIVAITGFIVIGKRHCRRWKKISNGKAGIIFLLAPPSRASAAVGGLVNGRKKRGRP